MVDIPLQFGDFGNALAAGAGARYATTHANVLQAEEQRKQAAQQYVQSAIAGDKAAMGNLAYGDPKVAAALSAEIARMDANKRADIKAKSEYSANAANTILQANPAERPALYRAAIAEGTRRGYDMSTLPPEYSPAVDPHLRTVRGIAIDINKQLDRENRLLIHNTPTSVGGGPVNELPPSWAAPAAKPPGPRADAVPPDVVRNTSFAAIPPMAGPNPVSQGDAGRVAPGGQPAVQTAQAGPAAAPPGYVGINHRDPRGNVTPATIDGKPVYRNLQTGEMTSSPPMQQAQAAPPDDEGPVYLSADPRIKQQPPEPPGGWPKNNAYVPWDPTRFGGEPVMLPPNPQKGHPARQSTDEHGVTRFYLQTPEGNTIVVQHKLGTDKPDERPQPPANYRWAERPGPDGRPISEPIPGGPADPHSGTNPEGLTGDAFLAKLPPDRAAQIRALYEGRMALSPRLQASVQGKQLMSDLLNAYPNDYDAILNGQRQRTAAEFAVGMAAKNITSLNTAIQHLGEVHRLAGDLKNYETPIINTVTNFAQKQTGDRRITDFETAKHAVVEEISKVFRGMGQSDNEIKAWDAKISSSQSPAQLQGQIETITHLLNGRIEALGEQYKSGMGRNVPPIQIVTPQSKATLDFVNSHPVGGRPATSGSTAAPKRPPITDFDGKR